MPVALIGDQLWKLRFNADPGVLGRDIRINGCLLYTSDAADERSSVDLGGRRIIKKKKVQQMWNDDVTRETIIVTRDTLE